MKLSLMYVIIIGVVALAAGAFAGMKYAKKKAMDDGYTPTK